MKLNKISNTVRCVNGDDEALDTQSTRIDSSDVITLNRRAYETRFDDGVKLAVEWK